MTEKKRKSVNYLWASPREVFYFGVAVASICFFK